MRKTLFVCLLVTSLTAVADQTKSDPVDVRKDLRLVCELGRLGHKLIAMPEFKGQEAEVAALISKMLTAGTKTPEIERTRRALTMADPKSKSAGWKQVAKDFDFKNWDCPSL